MPWIIQYSFHFLKILILFPLCNLKVSSVSHILSSVWSIVFLMLFLAFFSFISIIGFFNSKILHFLFLSLFKYKFIYCNWKLITLQCSIGFAKHQHESATGVHVFPILNPPSHLPPHPIPLGHPSAPAPSILYHALKLDWRFVSYMILYMFQCHSPKSSHPRPLQQIPKDCSIHLCLFCSLTYRVIVTVFLNSIYMC